MTHSIPKEMQRLDKCVSHLTGLSRQMASKLIKDGAVSVNGELITKPMIKISINSQIIIDGYHEALHNSTDDAEINEWDEDASLGEHNSINTIKTNTYTDKDSDSNHAYSDACNSDHVYSDDNEDALNEFDNADEKQILNQHMFINTTVANAFKKRVFLMNKPYGYVCSNSDRNHAIVSSLWSRERYSNKLQSVGRLDVDTTGLLLFTDDGELNHALTSPKKQVSKLYLARLNRSVPPQAIKKFAHGIKHPEETKRYQSAQLTILTPSLVSKVDSYPLHCTSRQYKLNANTITHPSQQLTSENMELNDSMTKNFTNAASVKATNNAYYNEKATAITPLAQTCYWAAVQLNEGRYHEVKRLFEMIDCEVLELVRVAIGSLLLPQGLTLGSYIPLNADELKLANTNREFSHDELLELLERYQSNLKASQTRFLYHFNAQA